MASRHVTIVNRLGLHARLAALFVSAARHYPCDISIGRPDDLLFADAKDIMQVLSLDLCQGDDAEVVAEGTDEAEALDELCRLIESGFTEQVP